MTHLHLSLDIPYWRIIIHNKKKYFYIKKLLTKHIKYHSNSLFSFDTGLGTFHVNNQMTHYEFLPGV